MIDNIGDDITGIDQYNGNGDDGAQLIYFDNRHKFYLYYENDDYVTEHYKINVPEYELRLYKVGIVLLTHYNNETLHIITPNISILDFIKVIKSPIPFELDGKFKYFESFRKEDFVIQFDVEHIIQKIKSLKNMKAFI